MQTPTHQEVKTPKISARKLAEFMAGTDVRGRTIVRECKYRPVARIIQHKEAKAAIGSFLRGGSVDLEALQIKEAELRDRHADRDFDRDLYDHNADYIARFIKIREKLLMPNVETLPPGQTPAIELNGVRVTFDLALRLERVTRTNKLKVGAAILRYQKGKGLSTKEAEWQSALVHGYLGATSIEGDGEPELALCLTIDAYSGVVCPAPTDSVTRFKNASAACANIAERWDNVPPPENAVL